MVVSHPKFVKAIKGKKTDKKDAQWIADLFKHDLVRGSFIPPKDIRQLRDLCRYWVKLSSYMTGEKNRAQNCLTVSNFKLDDVFSNVFGKSASAITTQLLEHPGEPTQAQKLFNGPALGLFCNLISKCLFHDTDCITGAAGWQGQEAPAVCF